MTNKLDPKQKLDIEEILPRHYAVSPQSFLKTLTDSR